VWFIREPTSRRGSTGEGITRWIATSNKVRILRKIVFVNTEEWDDTPTGKMVPEKAVSGVVQAVHEELGRAGAKPTRRELQKQRLCIKETNVRKFLRNCTVCGQYNAGRRGQRVDGLTIKSMIPWGSVCMDVAGPMALTGKKGEKYIQEPSRRPTGTA